MVLFSLSAGGTLWALRILDPRTLLLVAMIRLHCTAGVSVRICDARWKWSCRRVVLMKNYYKNKW